MIIFYIPVFIFGLVIGSFLNSVIWRLEKEESFLKGRSYCPSCKHPLSWQDLIPVFSFLFLKGRCRYCQGKISLQYPLVEIATALLFLFVLIYLGLTPVSLIYYFIIIAILIVIFVFDLKYYLIPDKVIYPAIGIALVYLFIHPSFLLLGVVSAFGSALFFALIILVSRGRWLGFGDVKLAFFMGLFLGFPNILVALFLSFFIGAIIGIGLILSGKKSLKSEIPFGPFLVTGTLLAVFFGEFLTNWYLNLLIPLQ